MQQHSVTPAAKAGSLGGCSTAKAAPTSIGSPSEVPVPCISSAPTVLGSTCPACRADRITCATFHEETVCVSSNSHAGSDALI
jgi:hypothetical protein